MTEPTPKKSDLGVRTASAIVMVAVAGTALWLGGWVWTLFVAAVALGVLWEWWGLVVGFTTTVISRCIWSACGLAYVGLAAFILVIMRALITNSVLVQLYPQIFSILPYPKLYEIWPLLVVIVAVIAVDIGAYFAGRAIGGAKIAPSISPSKTWAGLGGGMIGAATALIITRVVYLRFIEICIYPGVCEPTPHQIPSSEVIFAIAYGALAAVVAQSGDFFESWMKRRAGVKDSGKLIPGHGGLFDRVDGLLAVCFGIGVLSLSVNVLRWLT